MYGTQPMAAGAIVTPATKEDSPIEVEDMRTSNAVMVRRVGSVLFLCLGVALISTGVVMPSSTKTSLWSALSASPVPPSPEGVDQAGTDHGSNAKLFEELAAKAQGKIPEYSDLPTPNTLKAPTYGEMNEDQIKDLWKNYVKKYSREYTSDEEHDMRYGLFKKALNKIDYLNKANPYAVFDITERADLTEDELAKSRGIRSAVISKGTGKSSLQIMKEEFPDQDIIRLGEQGVDAVLKDNEAKRKESAGAVSDVLDETMSADCAGWADTADCAACKKYPDLSRVTLGNMPEGFDWRALNAVSDVKNQKYCGSCWTFSTAGDLEGTHFLATGEMVSLSEQQLVACDVVNYGCDGGYPFSAMQYIHKIGGMLHNDDYVYKGICAWDACGTGYAGTPSCAKEVLNENIEKGNVAFLGAWQMVAMGKEYEELMRIVMVKNGPISIAFDASDMDYYVHGVVGCPAEGYCKAGAIDHHDGCDPDEIDHAVLLVGYGTQDGIPYWVIKNSWGATWGEAGYFRMIRGVNHCGVANFAVHSIAKDVEQ